MTPPNKTARQLLGELRTALKGFEASLSDCNSQIDSLRARAGNADELENELRQLDASEASLFTLAAQSDDPAALDNVKVDTKRRAALQKELAVARARKSGVDAAVSKLELHRRDFVAGRDGALRALPVLEMSVALDEFVPATVERALEFAARAERDFAALNQIYADLVRLAHSQPEGGPHRAGLFQRAELLAKTIRGVRQTNHSEKAAATARDHINQFFAGLVDDNQMEEESINAAA